MKKQPKTNKNIKNTSYIIKPKFENLICSLSFPVLPSALSVTSPVANNVNAAGGQPLRPIKFVYPTRRLIEPTRTLPFPTVYERCMCVLTRRPTPALRVSHSDWHNRLSVILNSTLLTIQSTDNYHLQLNFIRLK